MWALHDRIETHVTEDTCRAEIESISKHGQLVPVLGRPLQNDPDYDVELIYGARRLFVARLINRPLLVELRELPDREAVIAMDVENRLRQDISPYERGRSYARYLQSGFFKSQDDIARSLKISASQVSRLLKVAQLPAVIVGAFRNPVDICEGWGLDIMEALEDPARRVATLTKARRLREQAGRYSPRDIYQQLMLAGARAPKVRRAAHDEVVKDDHGLPLFRIRHLTGTAAFLVRTEMLDAASLDSIRHALSSILTHVRPLRAAAAQRGKDSRPDRNAHVVSTCFEETVFSAESAAKENGTEFAPRTVHARSG
jgi:ParB family chromosome partitioning protein